MDNKFSREILDDLDSQRFQENTARKFAQQGNTGITSGCICGPAADKIDLGNNIWRVKHSLGREPIGFVTIAQGTTDSVLTKMTNMNTQTVDIEFVKDSRNLTLPVTFTIFLY